MANAPKIGEFIDSCKPRPIVMALTATIRPKEYKKVVKLLKMENVKPHVVSLDRPNLILLKKHCMSMDEKLHELKKAIRKYHENGSIIVYCTTCDYVDAVYNYLDKRYPDQVVRCHSAVTEQTRARHERLFLNGEKSIMVATSAFGMGVDKGDIELIVHFNMPLSIGEYYQQAGRAGRDGRTARCVLLYNHSDFMIGRALTKDLQKDARTHMLERLCRMKNFASASTCMMQDVLAYFGEYKHKTCKHCTNCQRNRRV